MLIVYEGKFNWKVYYTERISLLQPCHLRVNHSQNIIILTYFYAFISILWYAHIRTCIYSMCIYVSVYMCVCYSYCTKTWFFSWNNWDDGHLSMAVHTKLYYYFNWSIIDNITLVSTIQYHDSVFVYTANWSSS